MRRKKVHPYFFAIEVKKSLAEPDDFFYHKGTQRLY
jgi:hypothetical protein